MKKRLLSIGLVLAMVLTMIPTTAFATESKKQINYVSIGDSMTNGYGLDGYDAEAGVYDYGYESYANKFAAYLAGLTDEEFAGQVSEAKAIKSKDFGWKFESDETVVNHAQLALSASRPEDLNFLLRLDYDDPAVKELLDKYPTNDKVYWNCGDHSGVNRDEIVYCAQCKYDHIDLPGYDVWDGGHSVDDYPAWWTLVQGQKWADLIGYGDYWTWKELTEDYRFGTTTTYIKSAFGTDAEKARAEELMASRPAKPRDDGSNGYEACYTAKHYQEMVKNADVISVAVGNGNFGVWLMGRITDAIMEYDGIGRNGAYKIEDALRNCDPTVRKLAYNVLEEVDPYIDEYVRAMMGNLPEETQKSVKEVATYAVVSFMANYHGMLEQIVELNPDAEIMMLGLMNTYAGDDAMAEEGVLTIGSILDVLFPPLSAFVAALPAYLQETQSEKYGEATFYYAEEYTIECLIHNFGDEEFYGWNGVSRDRFVTGLVGECDDDCGKDIFECKKLNGLFWSMLNGYNLGGVTIHGITKQDIVDYEALKDDAARAEYAYVNKDKAASIAVYLAIEDAVCKSGRVAPVTLSTLTNLSLNNPALLETALGNFGVELEKIIRDYNEDAVKGLNAAGVQNPTQTQINDMSMVLALPTALSNALWTDSLLCSMLAVVARNKLGNGLGAHPSEDGHAALAGAMIEAYENGNTVQDQTSANLNAAWNWLMDYAQENYPEAYEAIAQLADYIGSEEFAALCAELEALYNRLDSATTPEQKARLAEETYRLITRLQEIAAMATAKNLENIDYYVSIGDSTLTGYGLDEYEQDKNNGEDQVLGVEAPVLLAEKLFGEEYEQHFKKLDKGGLRTNDILVWLGLNEYQDDFYKRYTMDENAVEKETAYYQNLYRTEIEKADLITLTLGGGDISTFVGFQAKALAKGEPAYAMDWTRYFPEADMTEIYGYIATVQNLLEGTLPEIMGVPAEKLAPVVAESFLYGLVSYMSNHSKAIERIHEMNPDAHVVVVGYFNSVDEMVIPLTIDGKTIEIPVGAMVGLLVETSNVDSLAYALANRDNTTYVSIADATTILDEQGKFDLESQLNGLIVQTWLTHAGPEGHKYIADQIYTAITTEYTDEEIAAAAWEAFADYGKYLGDEFGDEALAALNQLVHESYAYAYDYAAENGYIDAVIAGIDEAIKAVEAIDLSGTEATDAFKAEVEKAKAEIIETLEEAQKLILEADELDEATLNALMALLSEAEDAGLALLDTLAQAGVDVNELAIIPALNDAYAYLNDVVIPELEKAVEEGVKWLMDQAQEAYEALVEAAVEAAKKYGPEVADAIYDYLYNNPEEVIGFFKEYGDEMVDFIAEYGDEALAVLGYIAVNYGDEIVDFVIEHHEEILDTMIEWYEVHGENTWALIDVYLEALGVYDAAEDLKEDLAAAIEGAIAELEEEIEKLEGILEDLKAELENAAEDAKAEIEKAIAEIEAAIEELKEKVEELYQIAEDIYNASQDVIDALLKADEDLKAALEELTEAIEKLLDELEQAGSDVIDEVIVPALEQVYDELVNVIIPEAMEQLGAALEEAGEWLMEQAQEIYEALLETAVEAAKKYGPEVADAVYDYLYNNPEEVIAFIKEYGDEFADFVAEYGDEALAVLGYIALTYGDEIVDFVLENHEEILDTMIEWYEVHGENTWALIDVYLEALGVYDAAEDLKENLEEKLEDMTGDIMDAIEDAIAELEKEIEKLEGVLEDLKAELEDLMAKLEDLKAELEDAAEDAKAEIEKAIAEIEQVIAEIEKAIEEIEAAIEALMEKVEELYEIAEDIYNAAQDVIDALLQANEDLEAALKAMQDALADLADAIERAEEFLAEINEAIASVAGTIADVIEFIAELSAECGEVVAEIVETVLFILENAEEIIAEIQDAVEEAADLVAQLVEDFKEALFNATHAHVYGCTVDSYVALGGAAVAEGTYVTALGEALTAETINLGDETVNNFAALADYVTENAAAIYGADVITYQMEATAFIETFADALMNDLSLDMYWDEDVQAYIEKVEAALMEKLAEEYDEQILEIAAPIAKKLVYAMGTYAVETIKALETINAINPEAAVLVVGMYNPLADVTVVLDGEEIAIGEMAEYVIDATDLYYLVYAMASGNVKFVDACDTAVSGSVSEINVDAIGAAVAEIMEMLANISGLQDIQKVQAAVEALTAELYAMYDGIVTAAGNQEDIYENIMDVLTIEDHKWVLQGITAPTCTEDGYTTYECELCGEEKTEDVIGATGHTWGDWQKNETEHWKECACGETAEKGAHVDADSDKYCDACGYEMKSGDDGDDKDDDDDDDRPSSSSSRKWHCPTCKSDDCHSKAFSDLDLDAWYHEYTDYVLCKGMMNGMGGGIFAPNAETSRAMLTTILYRIAGSPAVSGEMPFADVAAGQWYSDAILWAAENDIVLGYGDGNFGPMDTITREQIAALFFRFAELKGMNVKKSADLSDYDDASDIGAWAVDYVEWAVAAGLMKGRSADLLAPAAGTTRAETAALLERWCEEIAD